MEDIYVNVNDVSDLIRHRMTTENPTISVAVLIKIDRVELKSSIPHCWIQFHLCDRYYKNEFLQWFGHFLFPAMNA